MFSAYEIKIIYLNISKYFKIANITIFLYIIIVIKRFMKVDTKHTCIDNKNYVNFRISKLN